MVLLAKLDIHEYPIIHLGHISLNAEKVPAKPDVTIMPESKLQLNSGIIIGLGVAFILIGFLGWSFVGYTYETLKNFFLASGYDPDSYYLFKDLTEQIAIYLTLVVVGVVALSWGALILKSRTVRELFSSKGPYVRLGNGLIGGGGAIALSSIHSLFLYILASDYLELEFFLIFFLVGVFLLACGILTLKRR